MSDFIFTVEKVLNAHSWLGLPLSFLGGIFVSLSPCVLPMLPITIGVIGEAAIATKTKTSIISLIFVLGITTTYMVLGVTSALFGIFLGSAANSFLIYLILGLVFVFLGLAFFNVIHISIFNISYKPKTNFVSLFILGCVSGLSMIPCAFPILGTILSLISLKQNIIYAILCLVSFSLGYSVVLLVLGSSTSLVRKISEKKHLFVAIKKILGVVLLIMGAYFLTIVVRLL